MFTLALMLAALLPQDGSSDQIQRAFKPAPNGVQRCLRGLPPGSRLEARITCEVNSAAGPSACAFDPETLTREQRYAVECYSRGYRFTYRDGRPATGRTITQNVTIVIP